ncbi:hypothetical protein F4860DRAFT_424609 [Xylaria cubensis]|nr:hypothetical protein F4860DRAFT_424609 [Xylaria cubensis]
MMLMLKALALALLTATVVAKPLRPSLVSPSRVQRRDPPAPSSYPLADACVHEWQYLNFDTSNTNDAAHLQTLHNVICSGEMRAISSYGSGSATDGNRVYQRYFALNDDDDDNQGNVASALNLIVGTSSTDGAIGEVVGTFIVDNLDFAGTCATEGTLAYTNTDTLDDREKIHFCDIAWDRPNGDTRAGQCGDFDPYPSDKIDTFSRVALHEMMHYSSVGPASALGEQIVDVNNADGVPAYDPPRVHGLIDENQDDQPGLAEINADSYAWMSLDAWISRICAADPTMYDQFFTQNPPNYD